MDSTAAHRQQIQNEFEGSFKDVLSILHHGVSGPDIAAQAASVRDRFFSLPFGTRQRAILDPRVVYSLEAIQRLVSELGNSALSNPKWIEFTGFLLRIEVFCLMVSGETGSVSISNSDDDWLSIPGTGLYLPANHSGKDVYVSRGKIINTDIIDARIAYCDAAVRITLAVPERTMMPPTESKRLLHLTTIERKVWSKSVGKAIELIRLDKPSLDLVNEYTWFLVPLEIERAGYFSSISFASLPNAVYTTLHSEHMFAETLVHESDHQWLYSCSRSASFWNAPEHEQKVVYRSPWREDPRPLDGILRGASAFVRVGSFWASLARVLPNDHKSYRWIQARAVLSNFQAMDALRTVAEFGDLSEYGQQLVKDLCRGARDTRRALSALSSFDELLNEAKDLQHDHDDRWVRCHPHLASNSNKLLLGDYIKQ